MKTLRELNNNQNNGNGEIDDINNCTNPELIDKFIGSIENSSTIDHYGRYLRFFLEFVEDIPVRDIRPNHLVQWIEQRETDVGKLQKTTIKSYLTCVSSFFKYLINNGYESPMNPAPAAMKQLTKGAKSNQYTPLSIEEIQKILQNTVNPRDRAIIMTLFKTGCRIGEITNLQLTDVDLDSGTITVRGRKHHPNDSTQIPVDRELSMMLQNWLYFRHKGKDGNLFVSYYGTGMTKTRMREIVLKCGRDAGIERANSHRYRYSFTTALSNNNCNPAIIAYLRGDSSKSMVDYYTKPDFETMIRPEYLRAMPKIL